MDRPAWAPEGVDIERPASSRIYDVFLGGSHNFQADREVAARATAHMPELPGVLREGRALLRRMVRYLAMEAGVRQFLDIGSGIPAVDAVHEIVRPEHPDCRVVYVDIDPVAVAHGRAILDGVPGAAAVLGDLRDPRRILTDPEVRGVLDFDRPIAVLLLAVLHFIPDAEDPAGIVSTLREAVVPGSYLAIGHASADGRPPAGMGRAQDEYARSDNAVVMRSATELQRLFAGWALVPPGLVRAPLWRPDDDQPSDPAARNFPGYGGLGRRG